MRKAYCASAIWTLLLAISILSSCSSTNSLKLSVIEPAPVYIPSEIQTIGIIDRSMPAAKNETMDQLDIPDHYPKSYFEMLLNTHNHLFGFSIILLI